MASKQGWLKLKTSNPLKSWSDRWFMIDSAGKLLKWFKDQTKTPLEASKDSVDLTVVTRVEGTEDKSGFVFNIYYSHNGKEHTITLNAVTDVERQSWISSINETISPPKSKDSKDQSVKDENWSQLNALSLQIHAVKLQKHSTFSKSSPFLKIFWVSDSRDYLVYKTEVQKNTTDPKWEPFLLHLSSIGGPNGIVKLQVLDFLENGKFDILGEVVIESRDLAKPNNSFTILSAERKPTGSLVVQEAKTISAPAPFVPPAYELHFSVSDFARLDGPTGKSDPFFIVTNANGAILGKSEVIPKTLNPTWKPFIIDLREVGTVESYVTVDFYDYDDDGSREYAGSVQTSILELTFPKSQFAIVNSSKFGITYKNSGILTVLNCAPAPAQNEKILAPVAPAYKMKLSARKLDRKDISFKSDPFFVVSLVSNNTTYILYRSEVVSKNLNPSWKEFELSLGPYASKETTIIIDCFDYDTDGGHDMIGTVAVTLRELLLRMPTEFAFQKKLKAKEESQSSCGTLIFESLHALTSASSQILATSAYQFSFSAQKLAKKDGPLGKSDPFFEIKFQSPLSTRPITLYRSEFIEKDLNPTWKPFIFNVNMVRDIYHKFTITVYDYEKNGAHEVIGQLDLTLLDILIGPFFYPLLSDGNQISGYLDALKTGKKSSGALTINWQPVNPKDIPELPLAYEIEVSANKLDKKDLGSSDPYFVIRSKGVLRYKSEWVSKDLNPKWKPFKLNVADLGGFDTEFQVIVFDYDKDGSHDEIGKISTTLREWSFGKYQQALINDEKLENIGYSSSGAFSVNRLTPTTPDSVTLLPPAFLVKAKAQKLPKADVTLSGGKSDPFFCIKYSPKTLDRTLNPIPKHGEKITMYRSEVVMNTINPDWKPFELKVHSIGGTLDDTFEIVVYDYDKDGTHDVLGSVTTSLREWMFSWCEISLTTNGSSGAGLFVVEKMTPLSVEDVKPVPVGFVIETSANKIENSDGPLKKPDPFFRIRHRPRNVSNSIEITLHRSNVVKNTNAPKWQPFELGVATIGGLDEPFTISVFDWDPDGSHDLIGEVTTTLREWSFGWYSQAIVSGSGSGGSFSVDGLHPVEKLAPPIVKPPAFRIWSSAMKLAKKDLGSSDPFFQIRYQPKNMNKEITLYRSEVILKNLNPKWREWELDFQFIDSLDTPFKVQVFDWDRDGGHDMIGELTTTVREWTFGSFQQGLLNENGNAAGAFSVDGISFLDSAQIKEIPVAYKLECSSMKLEKKDGPLGKSDPFFEVVAQPSGFPKPIILYRSEVIMKNLNPIWKTPFIINVADVHGIDTEFEIRVFDFDQDGTHDLIGRRRTSLRELTFGSYQMALKHPDKEHNYGYESSGAFSVDQVTPVTQEFRPPTYVAYKVQFSGVKLDSKDMGGLGKSDPFFEIKAQPPGFAKPITLYRSETIMKNVNPNWLPCEINLSEIKGLDTEFLIRVFDWDADGGHDLIGEAHVTFRELTFGPYSVPLINPSKRGNIGYKSSGAFRLETVQGLSQEMVKPIPGAFFINASGMKLEKKDGPLGKSDPFFEIKCQPPGFTKNITVHRSNVVKENLNPQWNEFELSIETVRGLDTPFTILCYDWDANGAHDLIGNLQTTLREWTFGPYQQALVNPSKIGNIGYQSSGAFSINSVLALTSLQQKFVPPGFLIKPSGMKLAKKDLLTKSDPFFKVTAVPPGYSFPITMYRSEVVLNMSEPDWKPFILNVHDVRGLDTDFTISCYDEDSDGAHNLIGELTTTLREWTFGPYQQALLNNGSSGGAFSIDSVTAVQYEDKSYPPAYEVKTRGNKLSSSLLSKSDPFFKITATPNGFSSPITLYRSEVIQKTSTPDWKSFVLNAEDVRGWDTPFTITVFDWDADGGHNLIGSCETTLRELTYGPYKLALRQKGSGSSNGAFIIDSISPLGKKQIKTYPIAYSVKTSGMKLSKKDLLGLGKSDPFFKVTATPPGFHFPITLYRSEIVKDSRSPDWNSFTLNVEDVKGLDTVFKISVFDWDSDGSHDLVGSCETTLREWTFGSYQQALLKGGSSSSSAGAFSVDHILPLEAKEVKISHPAYLIHPSAQKLDKKDGPLGKSDPFFEIKYLPRGSEKKITLYRSEVIKENLNPTWKPFELSVGMLGGLDASFDLIVYDWNANGSHELIGNFSTTLREWSFGTIQEALLHPKKVGSLGYSSSGAFSVDQIQPLGSTTMKQYPPSYEVKVTGVKISGTKLIGKPNPYFEVFSEIPGRPVSKLYRSEVNNETNFPNWKPFVLNVEDVGGLDTFFLVQCKEFSSNGTKDFIGEFRTTLREWTFGSYQEELSRESKSGSAGAFSIDEMKPLPSYVAKNPIPPAFSLKVGSRKLDGKDGLIISGSSDPFFKVTVTPPGSSRPITIYRSEIVPKNLNPSWKEFTLNVREIGGVEVPFTVTVWDADPEDGSHDHIGQFTTTLKELNFLWFEEALIHPVKKGGIGYSSSGVFYLEHISPLQNEEVKNIPLAYKIKTSGIAFDKTDLLSKSDPFFEIRSDFPGFPEPLLMYRSEVVKDTQNPSWNSFEINVHDLGGLDKIFHIFVFDYDTDGVHKLIGKVETTLREWTFGVIQEGIVNPSKIGRIGYETSGAVVLESMEPLPNYQVKKISPAYRVHVHANKLESKDGLLGKSDPFFVVQRIFPGYGSAPLTLYRSEVIKNNLDPSWKPFEIDTNVVDGFDSPFTIISYDWNEDGVHDEIGRFTTTLREWTFGTYTHVLVNSKKKGRIGYSSSGGFTIDKIEHLEALQVSHYFPAYEFKAKGIKLDSKDGLLGKSDPFFVVKAKSAGFSEEVTIFRSEAVLQTLDPEWKLFEISVASVGSMDTPFSVYVYDWDADGAHDIIGVTTTTLRELTFVPLELALINPGKRGRIGYRSSGAFSVTEIKKLQEEQIKVYPPAYNVYLSAAKLDRKDGVLGESDPFFEIRRNFPGFHKPTLLYRSEVIKKTLTPQWKACELNLVMTGGLDAPFSVIVYDWDANGAHEEIGSFTTTVREWTFPGFSQALLNKSKKGRIGYKSSGALLVNNLEPLGAESVKPIPNAYEIHFSAKLDSSSSPFMEIYGFNGTKPDHLIYRSERSSELKWKPATLPVSWTQGIDMPVKIKCIDWKNGFQTVVGSVLTSLRELTFGSYQMALYNKKKANTLVKYKGSGTFSVDKMVPILEPVLELASAYTFRLTVSTFLTAKNGTPKSNILTIISNPCDTNHEAIIYSSNWDASHGWDVTIPFEAAQNLDRKMKFQYYKGSFKASLRELAFPRASFTFEIKKPGVLKPKHAGILDVDSCKVHPLPAQGYSIVFHGVRLDSKDGIGEKSDPFFMVSKYDPITHGKTPIYSSETQPQTVYPEFKSYNVEIAHVGDWDNSSLLVECWDFDQSGSHDLIGQFFTTLRELSYKKEFSLINPIKQAKLSSYNNSGTFLVKNATPIFANYPILPPLGQSIEQILRQTN